MGKMALDNCCFCIDLRVGCFIIGYLELVASALATIGCIFIVGAGGVAATSSDQNQAAAGVAIMVIGVITLLLVAVFLAFSIVLVVGLHKHKPGHVKAYMVYCCVFLALFLIILIANLVTGPYDGGVISGRIVGLIFGTYCLLVVRSYYYQMLGEAAGPPRYNS